MGIVEIEIGPHLFQLHENPRDSSSIGTKVWPSSLVLTRYLFKNRAKLNIEGKKVLELGAGCGSLPSLYLMTQGCKATITDLPDLIHMIQTTVRLNEHFFERISPRIVGYKWGDDIRVLEGPFEVVIGTDIVFKMDLIDPLLDTLERVCNNKTTVYLAIEPRDPLVFDEFLSKAGLVFNVNRVPIAKLDVIDKDEPVCVVILKKKIPT
eukprot:TRINITY_DN1023_c0_g2_i1.p1 TRINITY_DN1023_c0_g2~~TRINITY_DN1023_c0_g2_i1.p1  ORF type:complete len:208 (+),score=27.34 TRINITY_DN1023_c0_g2_i1:204-827(+)